MLFPSCLYVYRTSRHILCLKQNKINFVLYLFKRLCSLLMFRPDNYNVSVDISIYSTPLLYKYLGPGSVLCGTHKSSTLISTDCESSLHSRSCRFTVVFGQSHARTNYSRTSLTYTSHKFLLPCREPLNQLVVPRCFSRQEDSLIG